MLVISKFLIFVALIFQPISAFALEMAPAKVEVHADLYGEIPFNIQFDDTNPVLSLEVLQNGQFTPLPSDIASSYEVVIDTLNQDVGILAGRLLITPREQQSIDEFLLVAREQPANTPLNLTRSITASYRIHHGEIESAVSLESITPLPSGILFGMPENVPQLRLVNPNERPVQVFVQGVLERQGDVAAVLFDGTVQLDASTDRISPQFNSVLRQDSVLFGHYVYRISVLDPTSFQPLFIESSVFIVQYGLIIAILIAIILAPAIMAYIKRQHAK